jgi:hypothetical protein
VKVRCERCEHVNVALTAAERNMNLRTSRGNYVLNSLYMYIWPHRSFTLGSLCLPDEVHTFTTFTARCSGHIWSLNPQSAGGLPKTYSRPAFS